MLDTDASLLPTKGEGESLRSMLFPTANTDNNVRHQDQATSDENAFLFLNGDTSIERWNLTSSGLICASGPPVSYDPLPMDYAALQMLLTPQAED